MSFEQYLILVSLTVIKYLTLVLSNKTMRDGRNIIVPRHSKGKVNLNNGSKYKEYIASYFNSRGSSCTGMSKNKASSLPPIRNLDKHNVRGIPKCVANTNLSMYLVKISSYL